MDLSFARQIGQNLPSVLTDKKVDSVKTLASQTQLSTADDAQLRKVAGQFEAIMLRQMLSSMSKTVPNSGLLSSYASDTYKQMLNENIADEMSKQKGIGLADSVYQQLLRLEEKVAGGGGTTPPAVSGNPLAKIAKSYEARP